MTTMLEQTGWQRPFPQMICQDTEVLLKVQTYTFDHSNQDFLKYFVARTGINVLHPDVNIESLVTSEAKHDQLIRAQLQDCWELFNQPNHG